MKVTFIVFVSCLSCFAQETANKPKYGFDTQTKIELASVAASLAADGYTSRRMLTPGLTYEMNPVFKPFVKSNAGTSGYMGLSFAGVVGGDILLRNHPRWKHTLNWTVVGVEAFWSGWNIHLKNSVGVGSLRVHGAVRP